LEGLKTRRSVRKYDATKKIPHADIEKILEAASYAPSAHNFQPWEFLVLEDAQTLASLRGLQPWTSFAKDASCVIIVCADTAKSFHREKENEKWSYADIDGSLAAYGVLLAAHGLGYGACFCGAAPMPLIIENLQKAFNLPQNMRPVAIIPVGVPLETPKQPQDRYQADKVHWEKW
jgi:nitroreductase